MFKVTRRVYRTTDDILVEEDDPRAAFLAYAVGDELSDAEARRRGLTAFFGGKPKAKRVDRPVPHPDDKAPAGLTVNRTIKEQSSNG